MCWSTRSSGSDNGPPPTTSACASPGGSASTAGSYAEEQFGKLRPRGWRTRSSTWAKWTGAARSSSCGAWTCSAFRRPTMSPKDCSPWNRSPPARPSCLPDHGAFPELLERLGGGQPGTARRPRDARRLPRTTAASTTPNGWRWSRRPRGRPATRRHGVSHAEDFGKLRPAPPSLTPALARGS